MTSPCPGLDFRKRPLILLGLPLSTSDFPEKTDQSVGAGFRPDRTGQDRHFYQPDNWPEPGRETEIPG